MRQASHCGESDHTAKLTVFHDGACPVCQREIAFLKRRAGAEQIEWVDISASPEGEVCPGVQRDEALRRFHVVTADGRVLTGAAAFAVLWQSLPALAWLGRIASRPRVTPVLEWLYVRFLRVRPRIQKLVPTRLGTQPGRQDACQANCGPDSRSVT